MEDIMGCEQRRDVWTGSWLHHFQFLQKFAQKNQNPEYGLTYPRNYANAYPEMIFFGGVGGHATRFTYLQLTPFRRQDLFFFGGGGKS